MSLPVVFRDLAGQDVHEAEAWYEAQVPGLGARFVSSLQLVVGLISEHPLACAVAYKNIRRALLPGFPYAVFYLVLADCVFRRSRTLIPIEGGQRAERSDAR